MNSDHFEGDSPLPPTPGDLQELGRRLAIARDAAGLGVDDVAQRLHLPLATVADLEAGRYLRIGSPVYLKGFLRSYLRLLALPEGWAGLALQSSPVAAEPELTPAVGAVARRIPWLDRYKWAASYVVGTALALTAVHWLVSNTPQLGLPDGDRSVATVAEVSLGAQAGAGQGVNPGGDLAAPEGEREFVGPRQEPPLMASLSPFRMAVDAREEGPEAQEGALVLSFDQDSWVEVRAANGERLAYSILRAGERRTFSEGAPFSVSIGNVRGVRAEVGGAAVGLEPYARGNVARFIVARSQGGWRAVSIDEATDAVAASE